MERTLDDIAVDIAVCQARPHVGTVTVRCMDAAIDDEERKVQPPYRYRFGYFRIEISQCHDIMPLSAVVIEICSRQGRTLRQMPEPSLSGI